jgi:hypothetical protein
VDVNGIKFGKAIKQGVLPKYLTQPNFKLVEYGYINSHNVLTDGTPIVLTEGLLDLKSLPEDKAIMSPGTSGLYNSMIQTFARKSPLITMPDSDDAGVQAFLEILNRKLTSDPMTSMKFCFSCWITGKIGDDINDIKKSGITKDDLYSLIVKEALPAPSALDKLRNFFNIVKGPKGLKVVPKSLISDTTVTKKEQESSGKNGLINKENRRPEGQSNVKKGKPRGGNDISWF